MATHLVCNEKLGVRFSPGPQKNMLKIFEGFRNFILRGNAVELAVGVVIGAAFNSVVQAIVKDFMTPLITINFSKFNYTDLFNSVFSFLLVAIAIYFFVVLPMNTFMFRINKKIPIVKKCSECLSDIPAAAKRCAHCGQIVKNSKALT